MSEAQTAAWFALRSRLARGPSLRLRWRRQRLRLARVCWRLAARLALR